MPRQPNISKHVHVVCEIAVRGKADSFNGKCWCGEEELFATWWPRPPKGWSTKQWNNLIWGALLFLNSVYPNAASDWTDEDMRKYRDKLIDRKLWKSPKKSRRKG